MKRFLLIVACVLALAPPAGAVTFDFVTFDTTWTSNPDINRYFLGVNSNPGCRGSRS